MPQVPSYQRTVTKEVALPDAKVSTEAPIEAFGGGSAAQAATNAGIGLSQQAFKMAEEEKRKVDDVASQEAYAKAVRIKNEKLYNPQTGAMNRKGKDAFGVMEEYGTSFDKDADEIEEGLANDSQKQMFRQIRSKLRMELDDNLQKHTFVESKKFEEETTESSLTAAREDGLLNYQNPGKLQESINTQKALIMSYAGRNGMSDEWVQNKLKEASSKTNFAVTHRLLSNGDDLDAKKFFEANKDSFLPSDAAQLEKALEEGSLRGETQRQATGIMGASRGDLKTALDMARKVEDPKLQESLVSEIKTRHAENEAIERGRDEDLFDKAALFAEKNLQRPDPLIWDKLSLASRNAIDNRIGQLRRGEEPESNSEEYYNTTIMATVDPDSFKKKNLRELTGKVTSSELAGLINEQKAMLSGKTTKEFDGIRSDISIVNDALAEAGYDPTPKPGSKDSKIVNRMRKLVDQELKVLQQRENRKATNDEIQSIVDNLTVKGKVVGSGVDLPFFGKVLQDEKRYFEMEDNEEISVEVANIPASDKSKIVAALRSMNRPTTDSEIVRLYMMKRSRSGE